MSIVADVANVAELISYLTESFTAGTRIPMDDTRERKRGRPLFSMLGLLVKSGYPRVDMCNGK